MSAESSPSPKRDALVAALNGVWGDHLSATGNPLALEMTVRPGDAPGRTDAQGARAEPGDRLLVLAHGLCMAGSGWKTKTGHDHGARLAADLNVVPLYLQYNSGLRVHQNGRALAGLLETTYRQWPRPVAQIILLGYSLGGLVSRSACHYAQVEGYEWRSKLRQLVTLGTPHHGSPVERAGTWLDFALEVSPYSAPIARLTRRRSAGIADLGHGALTEDPDAAIPLPDGVECYAVAGRRGRGESSVERFVGDGLVPIDSALGRHSDAARTLSFPDGHQVVIDGVSHLGLLSSEEAFVAMRDWIR